MTPKRKINVFENNISRQNNDIKTEGTIIQSYPTTNGKNYNYDYYCFPFNVIVQTTNKILNGYFFIQIRLNNQFLSNPELRAILGFFIPNELPPEDIGVSIIRESSFRCVASKGLAGHLSFVLSPSNPAEPVDPKWGTSYNTSLPFVKSVPFDIMRERLYNLKFLSPINKISYQIIPGSIRVVHRKGLQ